MERWLDEETIFSMIEYAEYRREVLRYEERYEEAEAYTQMIDDLEATFPHPAESWAYHWLSVTLNHDLKKRLV